MSESAREFRTYHEVESAGRGEVPEQVAAHMSRVAARLEPIRSVWMIGSGKGGVGKSAVTANLAAALAGRGLAVGALDADVNGPSLARMLDADRTSLRVTDDGVRPADAVAGVRAMSMDLLLESNDAPVRWNEPASFGYVWRGTLETGALREFVADVEWGELDVLLLDLPPGTDKLLRALQLVPEPTGVLLVTTPSDAARAVVHRSLRLVREHGAPVALVANMAGHVCERCGHEEPLFHADGARRLADETGAEIWAEIPFHPGLARSTDAGRPSVLDADPSPASSALLGLADRLVEASGITRTQSTAETS